MPENKVWYLGVDPGSAKTGFAWVEADGRIKKVAVLATETLPEVLPQILGSAPAAVILGNGTNCDSIKKMLMEVTNVIKILMIEEGYSTEEAENCIGRKTLRRAGAVYFLWVCKFRLLI